jgi:predicted outer membrane repeat protein
MVVLDSVFTSNVASEHGGALYFGEDHQTIELVNTTVERNRASIAGGEPLTDPLTTHSLTPSFTYSFTD